MADAQIVAGGVKAAPLVYTVPGSQEIVLKALFATFDGTAAAGSFKPCIRILAPGNKVVGEYITDTAVAAGASAEVSWFPGVKQGAGSSVNPIVTDELDYVEITSTVTVLPANTFANQQTLIASNSLTFDGGTRIRIEVYSAVSDIEGIGNLILDLWDNATDLGRLGQVDLDPVPTDLGTNFYLARYVTPSAGAHTYSLKGWTSGAAGNAFFVAGTGGLGGGGNPLYLPAWMRISV